MPKKAEYSIAWSDVQQGYELVHSPFRYPLSRHGGSLEFWLDHADTFHVCTQMGHTFTLRKESKQRGNGYWYAYKRVQGRVEKKYLGEKSKVTLTVLETIGRYFADLTTPPPTPKPPPAPKRETKQPTLPTFEKTLQSALHIYGFSSIPGKRDLLIRYRDLSKRHHPDTGGIHEDMVAVNLAYDYLKKFV